MRFLSTPTLRTAAFGLALVACTADRATGPSAVAPLVPFAPAGLTAPTGPQDVRISEFHYDNDGADAGEAIEVSGPAGTDLSAYKLLLYNGSPTTRSVYATLSLSGVMPATANCGSRGVVTLPAVGLQNGGSGAQGEPDGIALTNGTQVIEFISYEGTFTAASGTAAGLTSTDVGVFEATNEPIGSSIKRVYDAATSTFAWVKTNPQTFGACDDDNSGETPPPPATISRVVVTPADATVVEGGSQQFTAQAQDANGAPVAGASFTWKVDETGLASVDGNGLVTTKAPGDVHVTATSGRVDGSAVLHVTAKPASTLPDIRFSEIHYDNTGTDANEAIEIEGPTGTDITGYSVVLYDGSANSTTGTPAGNAYTTTTVSGTLATSCNGRGVLVLTYPVNGIQNGSPDGFALVDKTGKVVEFLSYEGTFTAANGPAAGLTSTDIGRDELGTTPLGQSLQRNANGSWNAPAANSFGYVNACGAPPEPPAPSRSISFSGRDPSSDPPLPVGFEAQIFATEREDGATVATTITWTSETPAIASIDQRGVIHALAAGTAVLRATAADGTTATYSLPTVVATMSPTSQYGGNTEFGDPVDADPSDDYIVRRPEYTTSYSHVRNTPNWVSFRLDETNYGPADRCNCFTFDPELPASYAHYTTADYTGAGAVAGYGIDRGHLARSADRTAGNLDNATTYYFSNIVPQAADQNQGPWAILENYLGDLAKTGGKQVYVMAGVAGNKGTVKNEGLIVIPAYTWKVAVIMPDGRGLNDVHSTSDLEIVSVVMPNEPGVRNVDWHTYQVTVDSVEHLSGYDLLSLLRDDIERAVEANATAVMDVQPEIISLSTTNTVSAYLLSSSTTDARNATAVSVRLRVLNGNGAGASVATRNGAYMTSVTDVNGDGLPDRMFVFLKSDLVAAGLSVSRQELVLEDVTGSLRFRATDNAPPRIAP